MNKITISLDESTKSTGYAIFENEKLIDYGAIVEKSKDVLERVDNIIVAVEKLINKYKPDNLIIEDVKITMSASVARALMGLQFMLELLAYRNNIKCVNIRTTHWRKTLGLSNSPKINRAEKKQQAKDYVIQKYGIKEDIDDITDAICIGASFLVENKT